MYAPWLEAALIKRPLLAAALCAVIATTAAWGLWIEACELDAFGTTPRTEQVGQLPAPPRGDFAPGRWVELRGVLRFDCGSLAVDRSWQEGEIIFGHRTLTYVPATDASRSRLLIFVANGALTCEQVMQSRWTGVIREASKYDLEKASAKGFHPPPALAIPPMRFETYGGPRETWKLTGLTAFAFLLMSFGTIYFWRKYKQQQRIKESALPAASLGAF